MVWIDLSNRVVRLHLPVWLNNHKKHLDDIIRLLPGWNETLSTEKPNSIILDIDEVLLCNLNENTYIDYNVNFSVADLFTRADGSPWGRDNIRNPPMPGAVELLAEILRLNIKPYFVTGRLDQIKEVTISDFRAAGFIGAGMLDERQLRDELLICRPASSVNSISIQEWKEMQRERISMDYNIIANVGDQMTDLGEYGYWQIYLPNPFYTTR